MRNRSSVSLPALVVLALLVGVPPPVFAQCAELSGCVLVWADEFNGTAVDLSRWTFQLGDGTDVGLASGWGNNELQFYRSENATVAGGFLTITAREESVAGFDYTSARIRSLAKGDWTFGRMEMRARMPIGQGLWPALWMLPSDSPYGTWAAGGEIDIVEYLGSEADRILGTIHYGGPWPANVYSSSDYFLGSGTYNDDFHVFAIEWDPGRISWSVDGEVYQIATTAEVTGRGEWVFDHPFFLIMNLAVGGTFVGNPDETTVFPQSMYVDYVRVYSRRSD